MKEKILEELKSAMKNQDKELLNVLRMVKGAIQLEEISKKRELTDEEIISVISKQIKTRKETIEDLSKTNRLDLVKQNEKEIELLSKYMPVMMSEEEIEKAINDIFVELKEESKNIGKVMAKASILKGKADMSLVNKIVKEKISNI